MAIDNLLRVIVICSVFFSAKLQSVSNESHKSINETLLHNYLNISANHETLIKTQHAKDDCDCGLMANGCHYEDGKKICHCPFWKAQLDDKCENCECGLFSHKCSFEHGKKKCDCYTGYTQSETGTQECVNCDCGIYSSKCELKGYSKVCTCYERYADYYGECKKCDCGLHAETCRVYYDDTWTCTCKPGYVVKNIGGWNSSETCGEPGPSGWRIATYVFATIFALVIIGQLIALCNKDD